MNERSGGGRFSKPLHRFQIRQRCHFQWRKADLPDNPARKGQPFPASEPLSTALENQQLQHEFIKTNNVCCLPKNVKLQPNPGMRMVIAD
jgi:hypothetical protein